MRGRGHHDVHLGGHAREAARGSEAPDIRVSSLTCHLEVVYRLGARHLLRMTCLKNLETPLAGGALVGSNLTKELRQPSADRIGRLMRDGLDIEDQLMTIRGSS